MFELVKSCPPLARPELPMYLACSFLVIDGGCVKFTGLIAKSRGIELLVRLLSDGCPVARAAAANALSTWLLATLIIDADRDGKGASSP